MVVDKYSSSLNNSSWYKSYIFIFKIQRRIFKSVYVKDFRTSLMLQKLVLQSNSARLLSIRDVTQISSLRKVAGLDGKTSLTFSERFQLNEFIKKSFNNWFPNSFKNVSLLNKEGVSKTFRIPTIADRVWFELILKSIEPAHEAIFHPRNFSYRFSRSIYEIQNSVFFNLNASSKGIQKRFLKVCLPESIFSFDIATLINKIVSPRSIKLGILRSLKKGLYTSFCATCFIIFLTLIKSFYSKTLLFSIWI
jgi:hypothetical protein